MWRENQISNISKWATGEKEKQIMKVYLDLYKIKLLINTFLNSDSTVTVTVDFNTLLVTVFTSPSPWLNTLLRQSLVISVQSCDIQDFFVQVWNVTICSDRWLETWMFKLEWCSFSSEKQLYSFLYQSQKLFFSYAAKLLSTSQVWYWPNRCQVSGSYFVAFLSWVLSHL